MDLRKESVFGSRFAYQLDGVYATDEDAANAPYDEGVSSGWLGKGKCAGDAIWRDVDGNGIINSKDMVFVGYIHPDKMGVFQQYFHLQEFYFYGLPRTSHWEM